MTPNGFGLTRLSLILGFGVLILVVYLNLSASALQTFLLHVKKDPWGMSHLFLAVYVVMTLLLFPCMLLQVITGAVYGLKYGMLMSWIGTSIGQTIAFLLGRHLFRAPVKSYLTSTWPTFPAIDAAIRHDAWRLVCLLRLSPVIPYNVLNWALALTPVSFLIFTTASCLASLPWTCLFVYVGTFSKDMVSLARGKIRWGS